MRFAAVIPAAGRSLRFGGIKKEYRILDGISVLSHSLNLFLDNPACAAIALVVPAGKAGLNDAKDAIGPSLLAKAGPRLIFTEGGEERFDSVKAGLLALRSFDPEYVLVHDAARPWASQELVNRVLHETVRSGAAVPGFVPQDTIKVLGQDNIISEHLARSTLRAVQTPQGFLYRGLLAAYLSVGTAAASATDDAEIWAMSGGSVVLVEGERTNNKITFPEDLP